MIIKTGSIMEPIINTKPQNTNLDSNKKVNNPQDSQTNKTKNIKDGIANGTYNVNIDNTAEKMARDLLNQ